MVRLEVVPKPSAEMSTLSGPDFDAETGETVIRFITRFGAIFRRVEDRKGLVTWYRERL